MQKRVLSYFIIIIVLIITGCTSSSGNRGNVGQFGSWANVTINSPSFSKPSIWQCAWGEENRYQNKQCD